MTYKEAFKKLRKIAKDEYCSLKYVNVWLNNGKIEIQISCYIDKYNWTDSYASFQLALEKMDRMVNGEPIRDADPEIEG